MQQHEPPGQTPFHPSFYIGAASRDAARAYVYWRYARPGDLVFDIGANCGEVTNVLLQMGCRVVAVEPQAEIADLIDPQATVVRKAVGSQIGTADFYAIESNPYLSTLRPDVRDAAVQTNASWASTTRTVPVTTLDALIDEYGMPVFVKIDVEGFEAEVLNGLSTPVSLSFEVHNFDHAKIGACLERLNKLGDYGYLYSPGESYQLEPFPPRSYAFFGDVYATLRGPA